MTMHLRPPIGESHKPRARGEVERLCRKACKILRADKAATDLLSERTDAFDAMKPPYPNLDWRYSRSNTSSQELRQAVRTAKKEAVPSRQWLENMRLQIAVVQRWEANVKEASGACGLQAAQKEEEKARLRTFEMMEQIIDLPSASVYDAACKVAVFTAWLASGYGIDDLGERPSHDNLG